MLHDIRNLFLVHRKLSSETNFSQDYSADVR